MLHRLSRTSRRASQGSSHASVPPSPRAPLSAGHGPNAQQNRAQMPNGLGALPAPIYRAHRDVSASAGVAVDAPKSLAGQHQPRPPGTLPSRPGTGAASTPPIPDLRRCCRLRRGGPPAGHLRPLRRGRARGHRELGEARDAPRGAAGLRPREDGRGPEVGSVPAGALGPWLHLGTAARCPGPLPPARAADAARLARPAGAGGSEGCDEGPLAVRLQAAHLPLLPAGVLLGAAAGAAAQGQGQAAQRAGGEPRPPGAGAASAQPLRWACQRRGALPGCQDCASCLAACHGRHPRRPLVPPCHC
jgi:hypothetical protein